MQVVYSALSQQYADRIRGSMIDDFGHTVEVSIAGEKGYGPCRCCLKQFKPDEKRLLISYAPVCADHAYNEVGPVYIHEHCMAYDDRLSFPPEVKHGRMPIHLVLRCYNKNKRLILAVFIKDNAQVEQTIGELFVNPDIAFIHIRNATYQCFIAEARRYQGTGS